MYWRIFFPGTHMGKENLESSSLNEFTKIFRRNLSMFETLLNVVVPIKSLFWCFEPVVRFEQFPFIARICLGLNPFSWRMRLTISRWRALSRPVEQCVRTILKYVCPAHFLYEDLVFEVGGMTSYLQCFFLKNCSIRFIFTGFIIDSKIQKFSLNNIHLCV